jgi:hypothetical protein
MFPVSPNEFFVFSVFWIAATTHVDVVPSVLPHIQPPGTLGTLGTALRRRKLGSNLPWNKTENTGNKPVERGTGDVWDVVAQTLEADPVAAKAISTKPRGKRRRLRELEQLRAK